MRRLALAVAAALVLAGAAEARPGEPPRAGKQRAGEARIFAKQRAARAKRRRAVIRGRVRGMRLGLPLRASGSPAYSGAATAPADSPGAPPGEGAGPDAPPPPPPAPPPPAGTGRSLQARTDDRDADQLKLILSRTTVLAGEVRIEFNNQFAEDPHDLLVERAGGSGASYAFPELDPGAVDRRTVALDAGEWRLRCTIPTHAERGMTAALTVTG